MAPTLGKRKRRAPEAKVEARESSEEDSESGEEDAQAIFKRHFEARFAPLPGVKRRIVIPVEEVEEEDDGEESDWDGISEPEDGGHVEVVEHTAYKAQMAAMPKAELKAFMTSKPPTSSIPSLLASSKATSAPEDDLSESANLKHDLALQRLLSESHLLDSSASPTLSGTNRHKATDLRLQALGSKKSILTQEKMPASHRRGIVAKKSEKEDRRRKEARENGIILEKATGKLDPKGKGKEGGKRERGIGGPGVGKFSSGTLTLSKKDIFDIEGPRKSFSGKGGRGGSSSRGRGGRGGKRGES